MHSLVSRVTLRYTTTYIHRPCLQYKLQTQISLQSLLRKFRLLSFSLQNERPSTEATLYVHYSTTQNRPVIYYQCVSYQNHRSRNYQQNLQETKHKRFILPCPCHITPTGRRRLCTPNSLNDNLR